MPDLEPTLPKLKILLVDDNDMMRIYFRDIFWLHGLENTYSLFVCGSIEEAEEYLVSADLHPDLVFLDPLLKLKKSDMGTARMEIGFDFLKRIKHDPACAATKVILFSSHIDDEVAHTAVSCGADYVLKKENSMPNDLVKFVESFASKVPQVNSDK